MTNERLRVLNFNKEKKVKYTTKNQNNHRICLALCYTIIWLNPSKSKVIIKAYFYYCTLFTIRKKLISIAISGVYVFYPSKQIRLMDYLKCTKHGNFFLFCLKYKVLSLYFRNTFRGQMVSCVILICLTYASAVW